MALWLLLYLQYIVKNPGIPRTEINSTNKTMLPDEPNIVAATRYKHCRVLHCLFTSSLFVYVSVFL